MTAELIAALEPLVRRVRTDVTATKRGGRMSWTREPLTEERLAQHLDGGAARGVCPIKAGEATTMVGLLDLDSHKGESTWEDMTAAAQPIMDELEARYMAPVAFRSTGGRGIHIYVLWDTPQDAYSVRSELIDTIGALGYRNGTAGVARGEIEVFPKQNSVPADGFGNQFILPLAGQSEYLEPFMGLDPMGRVVPAWPSSVPVVPRAAPERQVPAGFAFDDTSILARALFAIPNDADNGPDRDEWFKLLCAFAEGGGDKETARAWTMQHPSYTEEGFDGPWDSIVVGKENGVPVDYLIRVAEGRGFTELLIEEFPIEVPPAGAVAEIPLPAFERDKTGRILPTITNTVQALRRPDFSGSRIAYDEFKDTTLLAWGEDTAWRPLRDTDYTRLRVGLEQRGFKNPGRELVRDAALKVAEENQFDSALGWAATLKWDGVPRVGKFLERYMGAKAEAYSESVSLYIWSALAARLLHPGAKCDMVPVLVGGQGTGKSTGVCAMSPTPDAYVEVNLEHRDDNLARSLRGKLVGELGELRGLATKDGEAIKAWITRTHEEWIPKYVEFATKFPRRLLFIGTTNTREFLADDTGERRWLPVDVGSVDVAGIEADRDQLWAEGIALYKNNGVYWRDAMSLAESKHDDYKITDPWAETIVAWLLNDEDEMGALGAARWRMPFKTEHILSLALQLDSRSQGIREQKRVASVLRRLGFKSRRSTGGKHVWERAENCTFGDLA